MPSVLVVDDSPLDIRLAARILREVGFDVRTATNGKLALEALATTETDLVLTDLQMPELDGLRLVVEAGRLYPSIPVILMTAFGSESTAVEALRLGAASYVPKQNLARDLLGTVKNVLTISRSKRESRAILDSMTQVHAEYVLNNTIEGLDSLISHLKDQLRQMQLFGEGELIRVGTALYEALINAIEHGNLEVSSDTREQQNAGYRRTLEERSLRAPFRNRHVHLSTYLTRTQAKFVIRDEGSGFDPATLPDPTSPDNVDKTNGRGLFLIRTFMDEVRFNKTGNEITMIKRRADR